jgi:hypothetical protein
MQRWEKRSLISYLMLTLLYELNAERRQKTNGSQPNWDARDEIMQRTTKGQSLQLEGRSKNGGEVVETGRKQRTLTSRT